MSKTAADDTTAPTLPADAPAPKRGKPEISAPPPTPKGVARALAAAAKTANDPQVKAIRQAVRDQGDMNTAAQSNPPRRQTQQFRRREFDTAGRETAS